MSSYTTFPQDAIKNCKSQNVVKSDTFNSVLERLTDPKCYSSGFHAACPACSSGTVFVRLGNNGETLIDCSRECSAAAIALSIGMSVEGIGGNR